MLLVHNAWTTFLKWVAGISLFGTSFLMLVAVLATYGLGHLALAIITWPISLAVVACLALLNGAPWLGLFGIVLPAACLLLIQWCAPRRG